MDKIFVIICWACSFASAFVCGYSYSQIRGWEKRQEKPAPIVVTPPTINVAAPEVKIVQQEAGNSYSVAPDLASEPLRERLAQAEVDVEIANDVCDHMKSVWDRQCKLTKNGATSAEECERHQRAWHRAVLDVSKAESKVRELRAMIKVAEHAEKSIK